MLNSPRSPIGRGVLRLAERSWGRTHSINANKRHLSMVAGPSGDTRSAGNSRRDPSLGGDR